MKRKMQKVVSSSKLLIRCTKNQAFIIERCLEIVSRIGAGQLSCIEEAVSLCQEKAVVGILPGGEEAMCYKLGSYIEKMIKPILFPELHENESYGIGMKKIPGSQKMYEMYKVIQNYRAKQDKHPEYSVTHHEPLKYSKEPLIEIIKNGK